MRRNTIAHSRRHWEVLSSCVSRILSSSCFCVMSDLGILLVVSILSRCCSIGWEGRSFFFVGVVGGLFIPFSFPLRFFLLLFSSLFLIFSSLFSLYTSSAFFFTGIHGSSILLAIFVLFCSLAGRCRDVPQSKRRYDQSLSLRSVEVTVSQSFSSAFLDYIRKYGFSTYMLCS